ncbi:MAG TPA: protein kinase [Vicinamibacterales bacterium]|nr:protein kinase [Vicinamibacterales bacterium]
MIDRTLKHYRITALLGAGGMGAVYLAQDTKLDRKVALKVLPADVASNSDRMERFVREAKAAAALNHPNIAHIYEIGDSEGTPFIAMEYVDGVTLREKIHHSGEPLVALVGYLAQVAEGLAKAHHAGIVHRDLKPDNVMITGDGYAKILDFGLAKLVESRGPLGIDHAELDRTIGTVQPSTPGMVLGTIGYMSPEQATGRVHDIDHRSDIFSFGCLLFEATTGQMAFEGKDTLDSLHKIVYGPTPQVKDVTRVAPDALQRVIGRCLAKDPARRYQSIKDLAIEVDDLRQELKSLTGSVSSTQPSAGVTPSGASRPDEGFWVAVLPFKHRGAHADLEALADGLGEDIVMGLMRFSHLRVVSRSSAGRFSGEAVDIRTVGSELGARYVMEGSLRQAGTTLRVAVQLVDATTGAHLWAETYDRPFSPEAIFALQDDLVPRIVSTVADWYGVLPHSMSEAVRLKPLDQLTPYEALLRSFGYYERVVPAEHAAARSALERAVRQAPGNAEIWAMLSMLYGEEHRFGFNAAPDPLGRALQAARQAVAAAPSSHYAQLAMAQALFFRKDFDAFRNAAERALVLNPMDGSSMEYLGHLLAFAGEWKRGGELAEKARHLNPHHPAWYWALPFLDAYRKADYVTARTFILKAEMPGQFFSQSLLAAVCGQLGERAAAEESVREVLALKPDFPQIAREEFAKWYPPELVERLIEGLRKAGLDISGDANVAPLSPAIDTKALADASRSIAVLPFENLSPDPDNEFFADGLTEEVIADLSVIRALRVISRTSAMHFKGTNKDLRGIARELQVRYVLEGSVRRAGTSLRVTAQLIDAENDSHVWAEKYSGSIEDVFAIQEEISRKIANALQLQLTDAEARGIAKRPIDNAAAYDCYMRARHEVYRFTADGLDRAQKLVDAGLSLIGENSLLLATRGMVSWYYLNFSIRPEGRYLDEAAAYAARALEQDSQNYVGIFLRGLVASKRGDIESAIRDLQAAREQKPGDAMVLNELIRHYLSAGQEHTESARPVYEASLRVDPLHPLNWAQWAWRHFTAGRLDEAVDAARRIFQLTDRGNPARVYAAYYLALANEREEAIAVFEAEGSALPDTSYGSVSLFLSRALQGDAESAIRYVTPQLERAASWTEYLALFLADGYSLIGRNDDAVRWLRTAVALGFINYPLLSTRDPFLANLRSDARFEELMRMVKARWQALGEHLARSLTLQSLPAR